MNIPIPLTLSTLHVEGEMWRVEWTYPYCLCNMHPLFVCLSVCCLCLYVCMHPCWSSFLSVGSSSHEQLFIFFSLVMASLQQFHFCTFSSLCFSENTWINKRIVFVHREYFTFLAGGPVSVALHQAVLQPNCWLLCTTIRQTLIIQRGRSWRAGSCTASHRASEISYWATFGMQQRRRQRGKTWKRFSPRVRRPGSFSSDRS
jgi:hypothetical protein